ncbi:DUF805 domain-containing protein [Aquimarina muelleri]|uniref:DUF805 domain-containing protein n=1 Tax=Aquimarina muelleri TaxID=279356 RepID=A0A918JWA4_9FLAO|nr:DUF805 domain-containing protein [Aquimarina muelleri]MCX2761323.1 DUF805 domain-containing protein [Aquimarina muelleri]GGX12550.1 hypothetical protein GCM10007384_12940 [Aquimarina muelleri]
MDWYLKTLKNYTGFSGRARRKEYWMFFLFNMIIMYGLIILGGILDIGLLATLGGLYALVVLIPSIAVAVRRMHDVDKDWWYMLIPFYNIILAFTEGTKGDNQYGSDPKAND